MRRKFNSDGTVVGTVLRGWQFSGWNTGDVNRLWSAKLDDTEVQYILALKAWRDILSGSSVVPDAVFYYNPAGVTHTPDWAVPTNFIVQIGAHHFYKG